ncbi:hypothetical protein Vadar_003998 [Vaccinium darrowii]|uniref:Uncharacterized protein n=1 Tax=Vaccinium darrowii TaxID=229202 RepID=A0ACB7XWG6_9ERIC|nr:hypothetical protein Vadar_003998 [Vaccinium darrowii]
MLLFSPCFPSHSHPVRHSHLPKQVFFCVSVAETFTVVSRIGSGWWTASVSLYSGISTMRSTRRFRGNMGSFCHSQLRCSKLSGFLSPKDRNFPFPKPLSMIHMGFSGAVAFLLGRIFKTANIFEDNFGFIQEIIRKA